MTDEAVTISTEPTNKSLEEEAIEMGLDPQTGEPVEKEAPAVEEAAEERPEWLPEKFKSAEDMAKAYAELESKQSAPKDEAPADEEAAREVAENAGIDFDTYSNEYAENGELSEGTYGKLAEAGIPRELVDEFIAGQEAKASNLKVDLMEAAGGEDNYAAMTEWGADNLSDGEIDAFNESISSSNPNAARMAIAGLKARYEAQSGTEPSRTVSGEAPSGGSTYRSVAELMSDMSDPRYESDTAFRADVEAKLSRSDIM